MVLVSTFYDFILVLYGHEEELHIRVNTSGGSFSSSY